MKLVDVHSHIHGKEFEKDLDKVIDRARSQGIVAVFTSTLRFFEIPKALRLIDEYPGYVYLSVGCDPRLFDREEIGQIREFIETNVDKVIAVGEIGLDYYWERRPQFRELQRQFLLEWIGFAAQLDRPVIIHSRWAGKQAIETVLRASASIVIMHAFDGAPKHARKAAEEGVYFSIPPSIVFSKQKKLLVEALPLDNLLLESDAPVLSPIRGQRNEPVNILYTAREIARIKEVDVKEVCKTTYYNTVKLFPGKFK